GRGPTAPWVNPHPRDYRQGVFKFTSSKQSEGERKPRREDLLRTLREGIEGTSMPSFRLLAEDELNALASYVIPLRLRGEAEYFGMQKLLTDQDPDIPGDLQESLGLFATRWVQAEANLIRPEKDNPYLGDEQQREESVLRGYKLFAQEGPASCISCHIGYG